MDLRERVMGAADSCRLHWAAAARFGIEVSSAIQQQLSRGRVRPGRPGGNVRSSVIDGHRAFLLALVEEQPELPLD